MSNERNATTNERVAAVMAGIRTLRQTARNAHFGYSYTPTSEIVEMVRPLLAAHGLVLLQREVSCALESGNLSLTCEFALAGPGDTAETAVWERRTVFQRGTKTIQQQAAARTFALRYWLTGKLLISTTDDDAGEDADAGDGPPLERARKALKWSAEQVRALLKKHGGDESAALDAMREIWALRAGR